MIMNSIVIFSIRQSLTTGLYFYFIPIGIDNIEMFIIIP